MLPASACCCRPWLLLHRPMIVLRPLLALRARAPQRALVAPHSDAARRRHRGGAATHRGRSCARRAGPDFKLVADLDIVFAAALLLAVAGAIDDIRPIAIAPRLLLQALAVASCRALAGALRVVPLLPLGLERALLLLAGVWFVNLVNFMDGIDWMTVAEVVPITAGLVALGALGALPPHGMIVALALLGAMLGFAPFNRPVARLFLGDVGSLPIGLLLAWLLLLLAGRGHLAAALLLPLYYLADATMTLLRRLARGEPFWQAHRRHFYQRATDRGFSVRAVVGRVFAVNLGLVVLALATATIARPAMATDVIALGLGAILVGWLLYDFARGKR